MEQSDLKKIHCIHIIVMYVEPWGDDKWKKEEKNYHWNAEHCVQRVTNLWSRAKQGKNLRESRATSFISTRRNHHNKRSLENLLLLIFWRCRRKRSHFREGFHDKRYKIWHWIYPHLAQNVPKKTRLTRLSVPSAS